jgi:hypothetical protein
MNRPLVRVLLAAGVGLALTQTANAAMHATKEFEAGDTRPKTIAFLPPHATLVKRKMIKAEAQLEESSELSVYLAGAVKSQFASQGYDVRMLTPDEINSNPELQELVLDVDRRYSELLNQVRLKLPKQIAARRYQAGDEMRVLAAKLGVDAIGFADLQMIASAPGAMFMYGGGTSSMLTVSVIDGSTATIEAYFVPPVLRRGSITGYEAVMADPAGKIGNMAELTLKELPPAAAQARAHAKSDDDVVSDVESLLKKK